MDRFEFDDEYVRRLLAGDRQMQDHFYDYFGRMMLVWLRKQGVRTMEDIEDVRQTTFTRVIANLPLRDNRALGSFVIATCRNVYFELIRQKERERRPEAAVVDEVDGEEILKALIQEEDAGRVRSIIDRMKGREGKILKLFFIQELPKEEVCRLCGVASHNFNVAVCRAKKKFKELFERKTTPPFSPSLIFVTLVRLWSLRL